MEIRPDELALAATVAKPASHQHVRAGWWTLAFLLLLPIGFTALGRPVSLYHLLAIPIWLISLADHVPVVRRFSFVVAGALAALLGHAALIQVPVGVAPFLSMYNFLAPYCAIPVGWVLARRARHTSLFVMATACAIPGLLTVLAAVFYGAMTIESARDRSFSIDRYIPILSGGAQVNSWGSYLIACSLVGLYALSLPMKGLLTSRLIVFAGIAASSYAIVISGSRANTIAILGVVTWGVWRIARYNISGATRHRVGASLLLSIVVGGSLLVFADLATDSTRTSGLIEAVSNGGVGDEFRGRDVRLEAMRHDIGTSPITGTGFQDFGWRHPELSESSPHNQAVGALHKMGLLMSIPYFAFLIWLARRSWRLAIAKLTWAIVLLLSLVYDVFTSQPGGVALLLLVGLLAGQNSLSPSPSHGHRKR